jgi:hypothetical protein
MISKSSVSLNLLTTAIDFKLTLILYKVGALLTSWNSILAKPRANSFSRKTNILTYDHKLCQFSITRTDSIKDLVAFIDSKLRFHNHVDYIFAQCMKVLGLVRTLTFTLPSLDCLYMLYVICYAYWTVCGNFVESGWLILSQKAIPHNTRVPAQSPFHKPLTDKCKDGRLCHLLAAKKTSRVSL